MSEALKILSQIIGSLAVCWVVFKIILDRYFKVTDELEREKKKTIEDNIKRVENSNSEVRAALTNLKAAVTDLETRVLKSQVKSESADEKLKQLQHSLEKFTDETKSSIKEVEKSILLQIGNDLVLIKSIAQKLRGNK